jgi:hypothetical protein
MPGSYKGQIEALLPNTEIREISAIKRVIEGNAWTKMLAISEPWRFFAVSTKAPTPRSSRLFAQFLDNECEHPL